MCSNYITESALLSERMHYFVLYFCHKIYDTSKSQHFCIKKKKEKEYSHNIEKSNQLFNYSILFISLGFS